MRQRVDPDRRLLGLAAEQAGVLSREQVVALGPGRSPVRRLLDEGRWQRLANGLYYIETGPAPWLALAWGGVLLGGDEARLAGEASAHLQGLISSPPEVISVLVPHGAPRRPRGPWQFVQERPGRHARSRGAPPRIDVEDTVLDLCEGLDTRGVVDLVTCAVQNRRTTARRLRARLDSRPRHPRRSLLLGLLAEVEDGVESPLELRYLRDVELAHGLPRGTRQHRARGGFRDVYYEAFATIVELDGRGGHEGPGRHRDMRRDNRSTLCGERTLRYGWWDVTERPCLVADEVATVLRDNGWSGVMQLCPRCEGRLRTVDGFLA